MNGGHFGAGTFTFTKLLLAFLMFSFFCSTALACEPSITFKVVNKTQMNLGIYYTGVFEGTVSPSKILYFEQFANYPVFSITAKDANGNVFYSANFTRNDVKGKKTFEILIPPSPK